MLCLTEPHNWEYFNAHRRCKYCGVTEVNLRGPIEISEIKPYNYGYSGKPTKCVAFIVGILLLLLILGVVVLGILVASIMTYGG